MRRVLWYLALLGGLISTASADIYIYNTTNERMTYQVLLPNGDTKEGVIRESTGYGPVQTTIPAEQGKITTFQVLSESGQSGVKVRAPFSRCYLASLRDGSMRFEAISWSMDNGQTHQRQMTICNVTASPVTFDLVDEKEVRKGLTLPPGGRITVAAPHGFSGSSGFHHLKFPDGHRLDNAISSGYFVLLYEDKRSPGKIQAGNFGHLTPPRGLSDPQP